MEIIPYFMDLIPVDPVFEEEIAEKGPEVSSILLVAGAVCFAIALITVAVKKNKK